MCYLEFVHGPQFKVKIRTQHLQDQTFNIVHLKLLHKTGAHGIRSLVPRLKMSEGSHTSIPQKNSWCARNQPAWDHSCSKTAQTLLLYVTGDVKQQ
jgi:hypothetical protein